MTVDCWYKPGAIWKARQNIFGVTPSGPDSTNFGHIHFGDFVTLLKYTRWPSGQEDVIVLDKDNRIIILDDIDTGFDFNLNPGKINTSLDNE